MPAIAQRSCLVRQFNLVQGEPHHLPDIMGRLDFIESKLTPKSGIGGKRVFIGEYGFPAIRYTPAQQDERSRRVMQAGLEWGCPFVLYWELYNNEVDKDGRQRGFWLINDQGVKQPIYETHRRYYEWARQFVAEVTRRTGEAPTEAEFRNSAAAYLRSWAPSSPATSRRAGAEQPPAASRKTLAEPPM